MSNFVHIDNQQDTLKISDAAKLLGVSTKTLRRWEAKGILKSKRSPTGNRVYTSNDLQNVNNQVTNKKDNFFGLAITSLILSSLIIFGNGGIDGSGLNEISNSFKGLAFKVDNSTEPRVLAATTTATIPTISNFTFAVNVPSKFSETVTFLKNIVAPNIVSSLGGESGELELSAGDGITIDGLKISNSGILSLAAGDGISIDGNKITNTLEIPTVDYTQSGWTPGTGTLYLSTLTDSVGIGTASPTSALHVVGTTNLAGNVTLGASSSDAITVLASISAGSSIIPANDLGADLGSTLKRFNNLWVANINSNSSQSFSGQTTFSYAPTDSTISQASILINPTSSAANGQLLGLGIAGYQRALIDADGDMILGYNSATSAPATSYPLDIYGHSGTRVAYVDTSGNVNFSGSVTASGNYVYSLNGLSTVGNSNQYIYTSSNGWAYNISSTSRYHDFEADGTSLLKIQGDGKVGIGTTSPTSKLHLTGAVTGKALAIFDETGNQDIFTASASGVTKFMVNHTGNVGIGTTTPSGWLGIAGTSSTRALDIQQTFDSSSVRISSNSIGTTGGLYIDAPAQAAFFGAGAEKVTNTWTTRTTAGGGSGKATILGLDNGILKFYTNTGLTNGNTFTPTEVFRIDTSGNVGIGTTSPTSKLHVSGAVTGKALAIFDETGDQNILTASGSGTTRMVLTNAGRLGLSTLAPSQVLDVTGNAIVSGTVYFGSTLAAIQNSASQFQFVGGSGMSLAFYADAAEKMRLTYIGLGIGTTAPVTKLQVSGATTGKALAIFDETGDQDIFTASASGTTKVTIDHNGKLGLGTTTPRALLDILSGSANTAGDAPSIALITAPLQGLAEGTLALQTNDNQAADRGPSITFGARYNGTTAAAAFANISGLKENSTSGNLNGYLAFYTRSNSSSFDSTTERLRIDSSGNIGIGTTSPTSKLHVTAKVTGKALAMFNETGDQNILTASASGTTRFSVTNAGNVLIGTDAIISSRTDLTNGLTIGTNVALNSNGHLQFYAGSGSSASIYTNNVLRFAVRDTSGFTGIGTDTTPDYFFDVQGDLNADSNAYLSSVTGNVGIGGTTFGTNANHVLAISTSTAPTTGITDGIQLYAVDNSGSHELKVMDEAGNATTLSPHNFSLINNGPSEKMAWSYYSERDGLAINVDMTKALRIVESLSGEKLIFMKDLNTGLEINKGIATASAAIESTNTKLNNFITLIKDSVTSVKGYFDEVFIKKSHQEELCVGKKEDETCIKKDQLDELIKLLPSPTPVPTIIPTVEPTPTIESTPEGTPTP